MQTTPARSSRITTSRRRTGISALGLKRTTSSPSNASPSKRSVPEDSSHDDDSPLDDLGIITSLSTDLNLRDVPQYITYIQSHMFDPMPEKGGMNSTRIAEVLNFRKSLPPFVTVAHVEALSGNSTVVEREIDELSRKGVVRRIVIPGRGVGAKAVGDGVVSVREWEGVVGGIEGLSGELKERYVGLMRENPTSATVPSSCFSPRDLSRLTAAGLLTATSTLSTTLFAAPGAKSLTSISTSGSRHAAGSLEAVGGAYATQHMHGGTFPSITSPSPSNTSPSNPPSPSPSTPTSNQTFTFSLPHTGTHLKLLLSARSYLLSLLSKTKFKELPLTALRERWDGGVASAPRQRPTDERAKHEPQEYEDERQRREDERQVRKRARGEFLGVLPGRTKKWRVFYGMRFEWILEECVGSGLVEVFETGSVGRGVRVVR